LVIISGLLLQVKKYSAWIQPAELRGSTKSAKISLPQVLEISQQVPEAQIKSWDDINRLDVRPSRGMLKVWAKNNYEIQIDTDTGAILQIAYRRSDIIESLHDGSFFNDWAKYLIFLPSGIILLLLWITGIYLFVLPIWVKKQRKKQNNNR
jgi:uncharacterized iron-regulated membrane protein